jgi:predicted homoserine dehydrogenase-like protein
VDYTLGGDFGGGVFVIGAGGDPEIVQPLMKYLKMGSGPYYLFYRPYHLCHMETSFSIAEAVLDHLPTIAPASRPVAEVIAVAKHDLPAGERLDGIGGYQCYGVIDTAENAAGLLPVGLAAGAMLTRAIAAGEPIPLEAVAIDSNDLLVRLRREMETAISTPRAAAS